MSRERERRELERRLLEGVADYRRLLYRDFVASREEVLGRYRYAEVAQKDLEDANARASELRRKIEEISARAERAAEEGDDVGAARLRVEQASVAEDLARIEGLARAAGAVLARPEFSFESREQRDEEVAGHARDALEELGRLREALEAALSQGEEEIEKAARLEE